MVRRLTAALAAAGAFACVALPCRAQKPGKTYSYTSKSAVMIDGKFARAEVARVVYVATPCRVSRSRRETGSTLGIKLITITNGPDTYFVWPGDATYQHMVSTPEEAKAKARGSGDAQSGFWLNGPDWRGIKRSGRVKIDGATYDVYRRTWTYHGDQFRETLIVHPGPEHRTRREYWYHHSPGFPPSANDPHGMRPYTDYDRTDYVDWRVRDSVPDSTFRPPADYEEIPLPGQGPDDPKPVQSLDVTDADFETVVKDLAAKTGAKVEFIPPDKPYAHVTMKVAKPTNWILVMVDLCYKAGAYMDRKGDGWVISRAHRPNGP